MNLRMQRMLPLVGEKPILDFSAYKGAYQTNVKATASGPHSLAKQLNNHSVVRATSLHGSLARFHVATDTFEMFST